MKKFIAILLVVLVAGVMFGAGPDVGSTSSDLILTTKVGGLEGIKLSTVALTNKAEWEAETEVGETLSFTDTDNAEDVPNPQDFYINLRSNKKSAYTIGLSGLPLASTTEGITTKIGYKIVSESKTFTVASSASSAVGEPDFATFAASQGMRFENIAATVTIDSDSWLLATADEAYTTTVTVSLTEGLYIPTP